MRVGDFERSNLNKIPLLSLTVNVALSKRINWAFESEPEPELGGRRIYHPRGKCVGGSSAINGMINVRGHPSDYDRWAEHVGCDGWTFENMLPYFRAQQHQENEQLQQAIDSHTGQKLHGVGGELHCSDPRYVHPLSEKMIEAACSALHLPANPDFAGKAQPGFGAWQMNQREVRQQHRKSYERHILFPV